jgi:hypothetical protein
MRLPGGVLTPSGLNRTFSFRRLDGAIELAVAEALEAPRPWPERVTSVLAAALAECGGAPASVDRVRDLAVGDRQFLLRRLGILLRGDELWRTESCPACGERFDFCVRHSDLPVKEAGPGFPYAHVAIEEAEAPLRVRVPTGRDQEALTAGDVGETMTEATAALVHRLLVDPLPVGQGLGADDWAQIEEAIEAVAPEVATEGSAHCPQCGEEARFALAPGALVMGCHPDEILAEVDRIASHYHWSEAEILALPLARRRRYLDLIDRRRGVSTPFASERA